MNSLRTNPKIIGLSAEAFRLYVCSLLYANEHLTDGRIDEHVLSTIVPGSRRFNGAKMELTRAQLWHESDGCWLIHDYLEVQSGSAQIREKRRGTADRVREHRERRANVTRYIEPPVTPPRAHDKEVEVEVEQPPPPPLGGVQSSSDNIESRVFEAWRESTGRDRSVFDAKRRRLIKSRLAVFPVEDLLDAVRGWRHSPHHRGENERQTVYNDLELLLRDSAHIERFRDLQRQSVHDDGMQARFDARLARKLQDAGQAA
jgi:hypothetical protein